MARSTPWQDDYWLPLMQLYLQQPVGVKPTYSRKMVELSLELHVAPVVLLRKMQQIARLSTPRVEHFWKTYSNKPSRLQRAVRLWREMKGFGDEEAFYEGVEVNETFEYDFRPLKEEGRLIPIALVLILDLYYRLSPITMVAETPEVIEMGLLLEVEPKLVAEVLETYQYCDPYLNRKDTTERRLMAPCREIWHRFGNEDLERLADFAAELREYFR